MTCSLSLLTALTHISCKIAFLYAATAPLDSSSILSEMIEPPQTNAKETQQPTASFGDTNQQSVSSPSNTSASSSDAFLKSLTFKKTGDAYQFSPVVFISARVQKEAPVYMNDRFVSKFGSNFKARYTAGMDTINTASIEGALMYLQAEGIDYNTRSKEQRCTRKNGMAYIVFYEVVYAQPTAAVALYGDAAQTEFCRMLPMDGGKITAQGKTKTSSDVYPVEALYINGDDGQPKVGPCVGGELKDTDDRAPYAENRWFSFPNTCPLKAWGKKSKRCRAATLPGLCDPNIGPNGKDCVYTYKIKGYIYIDDLVGITSMKSRKGQNFQNFNEFCKAGGVEFKAKNGEMVDGIPFWEDPLSLQANANRTAQMLELYHAMLDGSFQSQAIPQEDVSHFEPLPTIQELRAINPPCYLNALQCQAGCMRENYSQICKPCRTSVAECKSAPPNFKFPNLPKPVGENGKTADVSGKTQAIDSDEPSSAQRHFLSVTSIIAAAMGLLYVL